ncbi:unnamed protein product [Pleuronectes platessa]|uniref:Uncharacterized protein n=1 Tax=Pleuronectes platessa TaxID=8262 RepID=A0A9N7YFV6_PLEPL|nr:unnamed protein product [Pleuronectes platessa]
MTARARAKSTAPAGGRWSLDGLGCDKLPAHMVSSLSHFALVCLSLQPQTPSAQPSHILTFLPSSLSDSPLTHRQLPPTLHPSVCSSIPPSSPTSLFIHLILYHCLLHSVFPLIHSECRSRSKVKGQSRLESDSVEALPGDGQGFIVLLEDSGVMARVSGKGFEASLLRAPSCCGQQPSTVCSTELAALRPEPGQARGVVGKREEGVKAYSPAQRHN